MNQKIRVTIFNEHNQDRYEPVLSIYPQGIHAAIARAFEGYDEFEVTIATQDMPEHGLSEEVLASTDVLIWWSHIDNAAFDDRIADRICYHVVNRGWVLSPSMLLFSQSPGSGCSVSIMTPGFGDASVPCPRGKKKKSG